MNTEKFAIRAYRVDLGARAYDIHIEPGCLDDPGAALAVLFPGCEHCMVVSNDVVAPLYLKRVKQSLASSGWHVSRCILSDGEQHKTIASWSAILDALV
ncbi:MAG: 3-dehydroquinate synthase, partial [Mariprofundaceae bacterium]|nr:3-dehydroquinate synthase [Mariprofundaceae bacterium]